MTFNKVERVSEIAFLDVIMVNNMPESRGSGKTVKEQKEKVKVIFGNFRTSAAQRPGHSSSEIPGNDKVFQPAPRVILHCLKGTKGRLG